MKKLVFVIIFFLIALGFYFRAFFPTTRSDVEGLYYYFTQKKTSNSVDVSKNTLTANETLSEGGDTLSANSTDSLSQNSNSNSGNKNNSKEDYSTIPESTNNFVPFTPQAPFGVWDKFHDEACEEASLVMAHYYIEERDVVFSNEAEKDIKFIGSKSKGGGLTDLNISELKTLAESVYGYKNWRVINKPSVNEIKNEIAQGNLIIIPLAGRGIGNPYYKQPGPLYHMLVISGYDNKKGVFITQDPGTKRGKDFEYKFNTLLNANHDFPGDKDKIKEGEARILVVVK